MGESGSCPASTRVATDTIFPSLDREWRTGVVGSWSDSCGGHWTVGWLLNVVAGQLDGVILYSWSLSLVLSKLTAILSIKATSCVRFAPVVPLSLVAAVYEVRGGVGGVAGVMRSWSGITTTEAIRKNNMLRAKKVNVYSQSHARSSHGLSNIDTTLIYKSAQTVA